jgi:hypothetical protein
VRGVRGARLTTAAYGAQSAAVTDQSAPPGDELIVDHYALVQASEPKLITDWYYQRGPLVRILATRESLCIDWSKTKKTVLLQPRTTTTRVLEFAVADLTSIEVELITADHARGWSAMTGFIGSGKRIAAVTGAMLTFNTGWVLFAYEGVPALQVRALWAPIVSRIC